MKRFVLIILSSLIGLFLFGQQSNKPIVDKGYYYGLVGDSSSNKYIFISFLSNDGDDIIYIVPYILKDNKDTSFMHNNFKESLSKKYEDSIDGNILIEQDWTVTGFDNYTYYEIQSDNITFSLNIANPNKSYLDVFKFNGKITNGGKKIISVISSSDNTFKKSPLVLIYKQLK
jgi:hypothetical protein